MAIDVLNEKLIDLRTATKLPPFCSRKSGRPMHISGVYRLIHIGAKDAAGNRIRLETVLTPGGRMTSESAVEKFIEALTNPTSDAVPIVRSSKRRQRDADEADAQLATAGW